MKIEHIAMYVNDLETARDFFVKYLGGHSNDGYHNRQTDFRSYFLSFDDGARLEIMKKPGMEDPEKTKLRTGYIHVAFSVGSKEKVDRLTELLQSDGYEVVSGPRTTAAYNGKWQYSSYHIAGLTERLTTLNIKYEVSAIPTKYFCNAAYFYMLNKCPYSVFIHIPS